MQTKKNKAAAIRKTAEELKAKKKQVRMSKTDSTLTKKSSNKGKSIIPQAKKKGK